MPQKKGEDHYRRKQEFCPSGHEYSEENVYWNQGFRRCKICKAAQKAAWRLRVRNGLCGSGEQVL